MGVQHEICQVLIRSTALIALLGAAPALAGETLDQGASLSAGEIAQVSAPAFPGLTPSPNKAEIDAVGDGNAISVSQNGSGNSAQVAVTGGDNTVMLSQTGLFGNIAAVKLAGSGNVAMLNQSSVMDVTFAMGGAAPVHIGNSAQTTSMDTGSAHLFGFNAVR